MISGLKGMMDLLVMIKQERYEQTPKVIRFEVE